MLPTPSKIALGEENPVIPRFASRPRTIRPSPLRHSLNSMYPHADGNDAVNGRNQDRKREVRMTNRCWRAIHHIHTRLVITEKAGFLIFDLPITRDDMVSGQNKQPTALVIAQCEKAMRCVASFTYKPDDGKLPLTSLDSTQFPR